MKTLIIGARSGLGKSCHEAIPDSTLITSDTEINDYYLGHRTPMYMGYDNLILCSGIGWFQPFEELTVAKIAELITINIQNYIQKLKALMDDNKFKHIIFIGSNCALKGFPNNNVYAATKGALHSLYLNLKEEYKGRIKFSIIHPGSISSAFFWEHANQDNRERSGTISPNEIAQIAKLMLETQSHIEEIHVSPWKEA